MLVPLVTFIVVNTLGMITPGPDTLLILRLASRSRQRALAAAMGIVTGATFWTTLTVAGMAHVLTRFPSLLGALQLGGGCYLMVMGAQAALTGWKERRNAGDVPASALTSPVGEGRRAYATGLATNLSNPKIVLFMAAVLSQFLPAGASIATQILYIAVVSISGVIWFAGLSLLVSTPRLSRRLVGFGPQIDIASGLIFLILGASVAVAGLGELLGS